MWRLTLARGSQFLLSAEYSAVMCGAWPGTFVTWPWFRHSMIHCCALRVWSQTCVTCRTTEYSLWCKTGVGGLPDLVALSCCDGARTSDPMDGCVRKRLLRNLSPTQMRVWLLRNDDFYGLWCKTDLVCVQSLPQP